MRSYQAARGYFSFLSFVSWAGILGGGAMALFAVAAMADNPAPVAIAAAAPGVLLAFVGFFGLVFVQSSRATVDSAEYAQQALQLSRDQFEVSKQLLKYAAGNAKPATYDAPTESSDLTNISFDTEEAPNETSSELTVPAPPQATEEVAPEVEALPDYSQHISFEDGCFTIGDKRFWSRTEAEDHVREHVLAASERANA